MTTLTINSAEALPKLTFAQKGVQKNPITTAFGKGLLRIQDGALYVRSFNGIAHSVVRLCKVDGEAEEGSLAIDLARTIAVMTRYSGDVTMKIDFEAGTVKFKAGRAKWEELGEVGESFVRLPAQLPSLHVVDAGTLSSLMKGVQFAIDTGFHMPGAHGIRLTQHGRLEVVAVSNAVLSIGWSDTVIPDSDFEEATIPYQSVDQIRHVLDCDGETKLGLSRNHVSVSTGDYYVATILLADDYPNYRAIIFNEENPLLVTFRRQELIDAVTAAASFTTAEDRAVFARIADGEIAVTSSQNVLTTGSADISVEAEGIDADVTIRFDSQHFLSCLKSLSGVDVVSLAVPRAEARAIRISPSGRENDRLIQMALMRIQ